MKSLSWIILVGPESNDEYPCKKEAEGDDTGRRRECSHKSRNAFNLQKLEEVGNGFLLRESRGIVVPRHLDFHSLELILNFWLSEL